MKRTVILTLIAILSIGVACQAAKQTDSVLGAQLYQSNCAGCHGADAAGSQSGSLEVPGIGSQVLKTDYGNNTASIKNAILNGKDTDGGDLETGMPRFLGKLSDAEAREIIVHLQYLQ
jgi:mono/diheme cytochrome c family protein